LKTLIAGRLLFH